MARQVTARYALTNLGRSAMFADDSVRGRIQRALDDGRTMTRPELVALSPWNDGAVRRDISRMLNERLLRRVDQCA